MAAAALLLGHASAAARGDAVRILSDDREALQVRVDLIEQARREVSVAYYSVDGGRVSTVMLVMLRNAARRGVCVRLLIDAHSSHIPASLQEYCLSQGIEIREYHPPNLLRPVWLNRRLHSKLLVVDGQHLVVGSRNFTDHHFGLECINFVNRDVYVRGGAAVCARDHFMSLWESRQVRPTRLADHRNRTAERNAEVSADFAEAWRQLPPSELEGPLNSAVKRLADEGLFRPNTGYDWSAGRRNDLAVSFLSDPRPDKKGGSIRRDMIDMIDAARHELVIETPYPALTPTMTHAILAARSRGAAVRLLTNSLASTDQVATYAAYQNLKGRLLRAGVELWELAGPGHLHAKSMLVDGSAAMIGSYNFDARSDRADLQVAVAVDDPDVAEALRRSIEEHMSEAYPIGPDGRPVGGGPRHPGAEPEKIKKLHIERPLVPAFRRLL